MKKIKELLFKLFIGSPFVVRKCVEWWIWWSNVYQCFERRFLLCKPEWLMKYTRQLPPCESWEQYCCNLSMKWGADGIEKLFDVVSCPERIVAVKVDDCDGHAILAYSYFGRNIYFEGKVYKFEGIFSYVTGNQGHVVAVWKNTKEDYFMTSNGEAFFIDSMELYDDIKYISIVDIDPLRRLFLKQFIQK